MKPLALLLALALTACPETSSTGPDAIADASAPDAATDAAGDAAPDAPPEVDAALELPAPSCPLPTPSDLGSHCSDALQLSPDVTADQLAIAALGSSSVAVAGAAAGAVHLWISEPAGVSHVSWSAKVVESGPFVTVLSDSSYGVTWGEGTAVRFARADGDVVVARDGATPLGAIPAPSGVRLLVRGAEVLEMVDLDTSGAFVASHFVNNTMNVGDYVGFNVENVSISIPFTGPGDDQPLLYQTGSTEQGQCSIPAPFGASLGPDARMLDTGLSYGLVLFAWNTPAATDGPCGDAPKVEMRPYQFAGDILDVDPLFASGARWVPLDADGVLFGVAGASPWSIFAQRVDVKNGALAPLGALEMESGAAPDAWAVIENRGQFPFAWAAGGEVWLRNVCF